MKNVICHSAILMLGAVSGCAASKPSEAPAQATPAEVPTPATWKEAHGKDQQIAFMKGKIVPTMGPLFQTYDAKAFADFGCVTCHGPEYKDPKQFLPALTFKDGKFEECTEDEKICQFMGGTVVPNMAQAMGLPPFDPATHKGFGCGGCHAIAAN